MKKITVLGAGLVGQTIARDLAAHFAVTSVDFSETALEALRQEGIRTAPKDLRQPGAVEEAVNEADLVVGAVPGYMGYDVMRRVIQCGKNMVDISFFPEDPFTLDALALQHGVTVVTDCGVAPGMGNIILGHHHSTMKVDYYECLVGGLPAVREWPFEYKAVFSPADVIEEYTRPARYVQNGAVVVRPALSDAELVNFPGVGSLESWNSDGLRTLIRTFPDIPDMIEKTLRYPGTIQYLRMLRECGFFSKDPVDVAGQTIRPLDLTARLLFPLWKLKPGEEEFTVMRIRVAGAEGRYEYNLLDRTDRTGTLSMARTTGYTCTAAATLVANGMFTRKGICPPEYLGEAPDLFAFILRYLEDRDVRYMVSNY